jgi:RNA polymerase sigma factor (sigma-70 family)
MLRSGSNGELSKDELDAARLGFKQLLRCKRFSPRFIENHGEDLFGTATVEYSRKLAEGEDIENPAGWLVTCAWQRTKSKLEADQGRPRQVSTEATGPLADEPGQDPEDVLLDNDRFRKVREAVKELSANQRRVLVLSYFEGLTVREAGRQLRWHSSKAQRAHEGARRRLHDLLGVKSADELEVEIGLAAYLLLAAGRSTGASIPGGGLLERAVQKSAEGLAALKQHAATAYYRTADPTPLAAARPGTVATVVAGCIAVGGGATYCVEQGVDPLGAASGLVAASEEKEPPPEKPPPEPVEPPPLPAPPPAPPASEEVPVAEEVAPPPEVEEPAPEPPPPPPEQTFEPSSPEYPAYEATASESSSPPSAPRPAPADDGPQFLGEP